MHLKKCKNHVGLPTLYNDAINYSKENIKYNEEYSMTRGTNLWKETLSALEGGQRTMQDPTIRRQKASHNKSPMLPYWPL